MIARNWAEGRVDYTVVVQEGLPGQWTVSSLWWGSYASECWSNSHLHTESESDSM